MDGGDVARPGTPLTGDEWQRLIRRLQQGKGTLFIGTESGFPGVLSRRELAQKLTEQYSCPWPRGSYDLAKVTQYISTTQDPLEPAEKIAEILEKLSPPPLDDPSNGYRLSAELPFKIYVTTTMDPHLLSAMKRVSLPRDARERLCQWNDTFDESRCLLDQDYDPTAANPLIYRLYGEARTPASMVLTEDDFLDFLVRATSDPPVQSASQPAAQPVIPQVVKASIASGPLIFLGYRFEDLEFRVLVRVILQQLKRNPAQNHLVLLVGEEGDLDAERIQQLQNFYSKYCAKAPRHIRTCWVSATQFLQELKVQWKP